MALLPVLCSAAVLAGALSILAVKAVFETKTSGGDQFNKPFFMCLIVASAMATSLPVWLLDKRMHCCSAKQRLANTPPPISASLPADPTTVFASVTEATVMASAANILETTGNPTGVDAAVGVGVNDEHCGGIGEAQGGSGEGSIMESSILLLPDAEVPLMKVSMWVLLPLAVSDLSCSVCDNVSIMLAPASIIGMVNCAILVFCALSTKAVLGTTYSRQQWAGICLAMMGICIVGVAAMNKDSRSDSGGWQATLGVAITLAGRILQSIQFAFEEKYMKQHGFDPLQQLLLLVGVVLPVVQALPGSDQGKLEDVQQAFGEIAHTPALAVLCAAAWLGLAMLNPLSMCIGKQGGSVLRVFMDVARSAVVWAGELMMFVVLGRGTRYGERWSSSSWLELTGFVTIVGGLVLYASKETCIKKLVYS